MILLSTILWCLLAASFGSPIRCEDRPPNCRMRGEYLINDCNVQNAVEQLIKSLRASGVNCCQPFMIIPAKSAKFAAFNAPHCRVQLNADGSMNPFSNISNYQTTAYSQGSKDLMDCSSSMKTTRDNEMDDVISRHTQPGITTIKDHGMTNLFPKIQDIHYDQTIEDEEEEKPAESSERKPYNPTITNYHGEPEKTIMNEGSSIYSNPNIGNDHYATHQQISKNEQDKHGSSSTKPTGHHQTPQPAIIPIKEHDKSSLSPKTHHTHDHGQTTVYSEKTEDKPDESSHRKPYKPATTYHSEPERPIKNYVQSIFPFSNNGNHQHIVYPQNSNDGLIKDGGSSSSMKPVGDHQTHGLIRYHSHPAIHMTNPIPDTYGTHYDHSIVYSDNSKDKSEESRDSSYFSDYNHFKPSMNSFPRTLDDGNDQIPYYRRMNKNDKLRHSNPFGDYYRIPGDNELLCDCRNSPSTSICRRPAPNRVSCLSDERKMLTPCVRNIITINVYDALRNRNSVWPLIETPCNARRKMPTT